MRFCLGAAFVLQSCTLIATLAVALPPRPSSAWYWNEPDPVASSATAICRAPPLLIGLTSPSDGCS